MGIFDKLFSKTKKKEVTKEKNEDPFKDAPAFKQMMNDFEKKQNEFIDKYEKIIPILKQGKESSKKVIIKGVEHELPNDSLPVMFPIPFDELSIVFGIDEGTHFEWLQNKHLKTADNPIKLENLINKAYQNLLKQVKGQMSIDMLTENMGMLVHCNRLESSFILVEEIWEHIRKKLNFEDIIYGIPTQDVFVFTRADKKEDILVLKNKVEEVFDNPEYPKKISRKLYLKKKGGNTTIFE